MRADAFITRTGLLRYRTSDGSTRVEYRPPDEVFRADSLETLRSAPLTEGHVAFVDSTNWKEVSIGHVETVRQDGQYVAGPIVIQDGQRFERLDKGALGELSAGYEVDYDPTPGMVDGQRYDGVQRNIRYNHVALLPPGTGRAGRECALRLDAASAVLDDETPPEMGTRDDQMDKVTEQAQKIGELQAELAVAKAEAATNKARADKAEGERDQAVARADKADKALGEATSPARLDAAVKARVELVSKASRVLGTEYKADGKSDREIMLDTIRADSADFDGKDRSDAYVEGRFDSITADAQSRGSRGEPITRMPVEPPPARDNARRDSQRDDVGEYDSDAAEARMIERNRNAWRAQA